MTGYKLGFFPKDVVTAYISYPYSDDPPRRTREVAAIASKIVLGTEARVATIVPHYVFDMMLINFIEQGNWLFVIDWELAVIEQCDLFVLGCKLDYEVSPGMVWEAGFARRIGKPVLTPDEVVEAYKP